MGEKRVKLTDEQIKEKIELCKTIHNNKYSYDKVVYVDYYTKVIITCPIHGDYEQNLYDHSKGRGCRKCKSDIISQKIRKDKKDFVEKSNLIHNYKYTYDKVPYSFIVKEKVMITCPIHGDFKQTADSHKRGCGCPYCKGKSGEDKDRGIIIKTNKINDLILKYQFDLVRLVELPKWSKGKYKFYCDIHGPINKNNSEVLKGRICGKCLKKRNEDKKFKMELDKMLKRHNNRFEYLGYNSLVSGKKRLTIRCKEHDHTFKYFKSVHMQTKYGGCIHCVKQYKDTRLKKQEMLIEQFKSVHEDRYGYDNVFYVGSEIKVLITCKRHGDFLQTSGSHLAGSGCPNCKHSIGEKLIQGLIKKMGIYYTTQKSFYGCMNDKTGYSLPFDIYLPEYHTCIEFDGYQHYTLVEKWGGEEAFKKVQYRDNIKNVYCKDNDINLIRIPYTMTKLEIVDILNEKFNKNLMVDIKKRNKWIDVNIRDRVKGYQTIKEFRINDNTLWRYCYKHKLLGIVCENMARKRERYTYDRVKEICKKYTNYTLLEKERGGLIGYIRRNNLFELVEHMHKKRVWTDEDIIEGLKKYEYKVDVRKNDNPLYSVALKRGHINKLKDKTIWWTEQMVRELFMKCKTKTEVKILYRGAENYAKKHGLYDELSSHLVKKLK